MILVRNLLFGCAFVAVAASTATYAATPANFPLYCRYPNNSTSPVLTVTEYSAPGSGGVVSGYAAPFIAGTAAYTGNVANQQPGECRWADRAFRAGEITNIGQMVDGFQPTWVDAWINHSGTSATGSELLLVDVFSSTNPPLGTTQNIVNVLTY